MSYYVRVFCKSSTMPPLTELESYLQKINPAYRVDASADENNNAWTDLEFYYKENKLPILSEINWANEEESIGKEEIEEILEEIGSPGLSFKKRKVIKHLKQSLFIVCNQLPTSDIDDDGHDANNEFLAFFIDNCDGMLHAENEGFYDKGELILKED